MAKYYVKCGRNRRVLNADSAVKAAMLSVSTWKLEERKLESSVRVSEVGFEANGDSPHHEMDVVLPTMFVKRQIKKNSGK